MSSNNANLQQGDTEMWSLKRFFTINSGSDIQRRGMRISTIEGISAIIIFNLLGGAYLTGYLLYLGAEPSMIGLITAIPFLAQVFQIVSAFLMQKYSDRKTWVTWLGGSHRVLWSIAGVIPFLFPKDWWIPLFIVLFTLSWTAVQMSGVIWGSLMGDLVPAEVRGRYFGIRNALLAAIGSVVLMFGGWILDRYPGDVGFSILFSISFVATLCNIYALWQHPNLPFEPSREVGRWNMIIKPFRDAAFFRTMWFIALWAFVQGLSIPLFGYVMLDVLKVSYKTVAAVTTIQTIVTTVSFFAWGHLNDRLSNSHLLLWVLPLYALSSLLWGTMLFLPVIVVLIITHVFLGISLAGYNMLLFNYLIGDTPVDDRPMYIAAFSALTGIFAFLGPTVGGFIFQWIKPLPHWIQAYGTFTAVGMILLTLSLFVAPYVFNKTIVQDKIIRVQE
jgi:MFS family permease